MESPLPAQEVKNCMSKKITAWHTFNPCQGLGWLGRFVCQRVLVPHYMFISFNPLNIGEVKTNALLGASWFCYIA